MIAVFCVIACLAAIAERLWPLRPQPIFRRGFLTDVTYTGVNILLRVVLTNSVGQAFVWLGAASLPASMAGLLVGQPFWVQLAATVLVVDFFAYWMHRGKHAWPRWWRLHEAHHSSRELDWLSSVRFHPVEKIVDRLIYLAPLTVLGPSPEALLGLAIVDAAIATASHSNCDFRIGPLIYVFVGPEMHRWHHARGEVHQQRNFGNNLSIFDWLFGTAEVPATPPRLLGLDDDGYPVAGFRAQLVHAFRPFGEAEPSRSPVGSDTWAPMPVVDHTAKGSHADGQSAGDLAPTSVRSRMRSGPSRQTGT